MLVLIENAQDILDSVDHKEVLGIKAIPEVKVRQAKLVVQGKLA